MKRIMKCSCGAYTLKQVCPKCSSAAFSPRPPKYSPDDAYASYRREAKKNELARSGLL